MYLITWFYLADRDGEIGFGCSNPTSAASSLRIGGWHLDLTQKTQCEIKVPTPKSILDAALGDAAQRKQCHQSPRAQARVGCKEGLFFAPAKSAFVVGVSDEIVAIVINQFRLESKL